MVKQLAESLVQQGVETHIATTNDNGCEMLTVPCGVPVQSAGVTYWYFPRQTRFYTFSWPLTLWLKNHVAEFDAVHIHALFSYATLPAAYWAKRRGIPYVVRPLGTLSTWGVKNRRPALKRLSLRFIEGRVLEHAAAVHFTSDQERLEAQELTIPHVYPAVIPNPIHINEPVTANVGALSAAYPQLRDQRVVLFMSRLDEKKGLDLLLDAFAQIRARASDVWLVMAGEGHPEFVAGLRRAADRLAISDRIVWTGFLSGSAKEKALANADVFTLPSYSENFGIAVAEALAAALSVVVSDQVAVHRDIAEHEAGLVVPCDAGALAVALQRLLDTPALRRSMGRNGRRLAIERYSADAVTRRLIQLYDEIAA
jgi:glycosyltransferase involved in cell wall biosynthesis